MKLLTSIYNNMPTKLSALTLVGLVGAPQVAHAGVWSSVASGCVLEKASIPDAETSAVFGTVSFTGTSTGTIRLTCPVTLPLNTNTSQMDLNVNYYDPDGPGTTCSVRAFLLRANLDELERGNTIVGFNSNTDFSKTRTEPATGRSRGGVNIPESLNSSANYYWVDLELSRSNTSCNPTVVGTYIDVTRTILGGSIGIFNESAPLPQATPKATPISSDCIRRGRLRSDPICQ